MTLFRSFFTVGSSTLASRVLGFVRESIIAATLGTGMFADAFYAAFRFPNLFRRVLGEGAFNSAFVPLFSKELEGGGRPAAREFAEQVGSVLLLVLLVLVGAAMIFMPFLVASLIAPRFVEDPAKYEITVLFGRIMFPYLLFMSLVAMLSGVLNSFRLYFWAAFSPVILNLVLVLALLVAMAIGADKRLIGLCLSIGVFIAGAAQLGLLAYACHRIDFVLLPRWPRLTDPVKRMLWLALPTAIAGGIAQVNLLVGQMIASAQNGAISIMNYADRIFQLPLGVIAIAIGMVLLPELSRALKSNSNDEATRLQNSSMEFGLALTLPAAVAFIVFAEPLVAFIFERGAFTRENTLIVSNVLRAFAFGLPALVLSKAFTPAFFAREDMKTPMWFSAADAATNISFSLLLFPLYGVVGIAIATTLAAWVFALLLAGALWYRNLFRPSVVTLKRVAMMMVATAIMGAFLFWVYNFDPDLFLEGPLLLRMVSIMLVVVVSMMIYFGLALALGGMEKRYLMNMLKRR